MAFPEICFLYFLNVLVVCGYFATASLSFFVLKEVQEFADFKSNKWLKSIKEIGAMVVHNGDKISNRGGGKAAIYCGAALTTVSALAFALLNLNYLLDGDIVYIGTGTTLAWFLAHFTKQAGASLVWFALYKGLKNERRTRTLHKADKRKH